MGFKITMTNGVLKSVDWLQQTLNFVRILELLVLRVNRNIFIADQPPEYAEVARFQQSSNVHNTLQLLEIE